MKDFIYVTIHRRGQLNCYCTPFLFLKSLGEEKRANKYRERDQDNDCGFTNPLQFDLCGDLSSCIIYYCFFFLYFLNDTQIIMFYMLKKLLFGSRKKI